MCVGIAPHHFRLDDNRSRPVNELTEPDENVIDAAESCPTESILVRDGAGNLIAPQF
jgi:ferredoxin